MLLLSGDDIRRTIDMNEMIDATQLAFEMAAQGTVDSPLRTKIPALEGAFLFMPAYARSLNAAAVKVINIFPHNRETGKITGPSQVLLFDGQTGYALALLDGNALTQYRTGASSGVALRHLARKGACIGGLIGTGGQAAAQLEAMICACDLEEVKVYGRNREHLEEFCRKMRKQLSPGEGTGPRITAAASAEEAVIDADVLITVTTSKEPVFDGRKVKPGCTVSAVGTYEPDKHELDPAVLQRAGKIYCDSCKAALAESGDLLIPLHDGLISENEITGDVTIQSPRI